MDIPADAKDGLQGPKRVRGDDGSRKEVPVQGGINPFSYKLSIDLLSSPCTLCSHGRSLVCSEGEWCGKGVESSSPGTCPLLAMQGPSATNLGSVWPPRWL